VTSAGGVVSGTVSAVLLTTAQTVVQLADGSSLLVDGVGALGDAVSIDLAQGQVVGGAQGLAGTTVPGVLGATNAAGTALVGPLTGTGAGSGSGRITAGGSSPLPANAGRTLTSRAGVTSVVQPVVTPPPLPLGL